MTKIPQSIKVDNSNFSHIMFMGTGSDVGKSLIVAGLCRLFANKNINVAPFKSQNMSNNAAVAHVFNLETQKTSDEMGEIGRAQWLQAKAAKILPATNMNPILLKPENEIGSQVIVNGKKYKSLKAREYYQYKPEFLSVILKSYQSLVTQSDMILVEGAGSPAETNLRKNDIANMGFAEKADISVILIGDIDRGGVIASIVGTYEVISQSDRDRIQGFIINKFRGDVSLFDEAIAEIENRTGWKNLGVIPYFSDAHLLPAEDSVALEKPLKTSQKVAKNGQKTPKNGQKQAKNAQKTRILALKMPHIANFDDLDPLLQHPNIELEMISSGVLPKADLIILPGSKSTIADLEYLYAQGWDIDIKSHVRNGGKVLGICGGFQMLGTQITDPEKIEGNTQGIEALGILDIKTEISGQKSTKLIRHENFSAYEIHIGKTTGKDLQNPMLTLNEKPYGAVSVDGNVMGSYLHGVFSNDQFRTDFLTNLGVETSTQNYDKTIEKTLDNLAIHLENNIDIKLLLELSKNK
ncbi:MAG: cobyric acid synthase [Hyphomicrobiales bacterium]